MAEPFSEDSAWGTRVPDLWTQGLGFAPTPLETFKG